MFRTGVTKKNLRNNVSEKQRLTEFLNLKRSRMTFQSLTFFSIAYWCAGWSRFHDDRHSFYVFLQYTETAKLLPEQVK